MRKVHLVVDGSNIATEGRTAPSLAQLDEAVRAFIEEYDVKVVTVVVDATFGHRIDPAEAPAYEEAILNGELITPPAGAIGRGDAFILGVAERANGMVLSNDSFQEFHGQYPWLFDEGRLIGGKPVPNVGWVFVPRAPVRGPTSRRSVRDARKVASKAPAKAEAIAAPPAKAAKARAAKKAPKIVVDVEPPPEAAVEPAADTGARRRRRTAGSAREPLNAQRAYAVFVINHPIGSIVEGVVDRFSSHGAYIRVGDAQCYVPLRALGDPPPRSAREVLNLGETRSFVVQRFDPDRKGIDVAPVDGIAAQAERDRAAVAEAVATAAGTSQLAPDAQEAPVSPAKKAAARKAPAKKAAKKKAPARKAPARKAPARKAPARKSPAKKKAAAKKAPARRAPAKKAAAKRAPAKKKAAAKRAPARKTAARKR